MLRRAALVLGGVLVCSGHLHGDAARWWSHVRVLADDKMEGRNTGTEAYARAASYVAKQFERAGLQPGGTNGYLQPVEFRVRTIREERSSLTLERADGSTEPLVLGPDATINMRVEPAAAVDAPLVFVGYGLTIPEHDHDDLAGQDLQGAIAVYVSGGPGDVPGALRAHYQSAGERMAAMRRAGVIGTIAIPNPRSSDIPWERSTLARLLPAMSLADPSLDESAGQQLAVTANAAVADKVLAGSGHTIAELLALADAGKPLPRFAIPARLKATIAFDTTEVESPNVVGVLPGGDPALKNEFIVLSAHLDHLGTGQGDGDTIYNGAMDNAAGVATLIEVATRLREAKEELRRSVVFLAVTGEEKGLLGSRYYSLYPTVPQSSIVANLNFDMYMPLFPLNLLTVLGLDESSLGDHVRRVAAEQGIPVEPDPEPERNRFIRSDQYNFIRRGVPALAFKFGYAKGSKEEEIAREWTTARYHAPADDLDQPVDIEGAGHFNELMRRLTVSVANAPEAPAWKPESFFRRFAAATE